MTHVHPHSFRHTFAFTFPRNGGNLLELQAILGHSTLDTVRIDARLAQVDFRRPRSAPAALTIGGSDTQAVSVRWSFNCATIRWISVIEAHRGTSSIADSTAFSPFEQLNALCRFRRTRRRRDTAETLPRCSTLSLFNISAEYRVTSTLRVRRGSAPSDKLGCVSRLEPHRRNHSQRPRVLPH